MGVMRIHSFCTAARMTGIALFLLPITGCTLYADGKPTLATTTSAEQTQRIFWQDVKGQKWGEIQGLLVSNLVWRNGKDVLTREAVVPYLQQLKLKDFLITNVVVKGNGNDMTVLYDLQLTAGTATQPLTLHAVSVWQQLPAPADNASKQVKKQAQKAPTYSLTIEDLTPDAVNSPVQPLANP